MNRFARSLALGGLIILALALNLTPGFGQSAFVREELRSALSAPDLAAQAAGASSPTGVGRPPRVGPNIRSNAAQVLPGAGLLGRSETSITGTDDGQALVAGWNDAQGFCGPPFGVACTPQTPSGLSGYAYSTDGGMTWTDGGAPPIISNVFTRGDPWLDRGGFDRTTIYYANLAVHSTTGATLGISVHRGHFAGSSFTWEDVRTFDSPDNAVTPNDDFYDKEALAAAKDGSGAAYVSLTNFQQLCGLQQNGFGQIEVWRTHDAGFSWQGPVIAGPEAPDSLADCGNTGTLQQSSAPAIGPNGEVYVVWQYGPVFDATGAHGTSAEIRFTRSLNGGVSFNTAVTVAAINSMRANAPVGYNRARINDHPRIAVATTGPNRGRIYVVYYSSVSPVPFVAPALANCPAGVVALCIPQTTTSSQVYLKYSDDMGTTWSAPIALGPAVPLTGIKRWWPVVSVQPGGVVDVIYYESQEMQATASPSDVECNISLGSGQRRAGTVSSLVDTYWVQSTNGGASFGARLRLSTATSNWCTTATNIRPNFGDYIGSFSGGNRVLALWADGRNGVPDAFFAAGLGAGRSGP